MAERFSGPRVALTVLALVALTAVIPPAAAFALAEWRIARAQAAADAAAVTLGARKDLLRDVARQFSVVNGPGRMPAASAAGSEWLDSPVDAGEALAAGWPVDPWGRCYLLDVRGLVGGQAGLLISAGPNSEIETPLTAVVPAGDDIAAVVR